MTRETQIVKSNDGLFNEKMDKLSTLKKISIHDVSSCKEKKGSNVN